jgi:hypothetical protein
MQDARFRMLSGMTSGNNASKYIREMEEEAPKFKTTFEHPSIIA